MELNDGIVVHKFKQPDAMDTRFEQPNWWKRRSSLERKLIIVSAVLGIIALICLIVVIINSLYISKPHVCLTPGCIHSASKVMSSMDLSLDPCNDFYKFSCGNYIKNSIIPDDKESISTFSTVNDHLQPQLRILMQEDDDGNEDDSREDHDDIFDLAKNFYKACMNKTYLEERGIEPLAKLHRKLGGWPVIAENRWDERNFNWKNTLIEFSKLGFSYNYLFDLMISGDLRDVTKRVIYIHEGSASLDQKYLIKGIKDPNVKAYYDYMIDVAVSFGANRTRAQKELNESLHFEIELAKMFTPVEDVRNLQDFVNIMTVREMQRNFTFVPWLSYINSILPNDIQIDENEEVIVTVPEYLRGLEALLKKTPKRVIGNYLMFRITSYSSGYLNEELREIDFEFEKALSGTTEQTPRWKECVSLTTGNFHILVGALYVREYFQENAKREANEMVSNILIVFEKMLREVNWMDDKTRTTAIAKLKAMSLHIGYPDELMDDKKLEEYYEDLKIDDPKKFFESILRIRIFKKKLGLIKLREKIDKNDWKENAGVAFVNAWNKIAGNSIQFPAAILQGHFFSDNRPNYMNYGAMGYVIGHEITHGFDDKGKQFDPEGNLLEWWSPDIHQKYNEKAQCIIEQYGNYTEPQTGLPLNGINTQGENIADNGGIKEAYLAYKRWVEEHGEEPKLAGLDFTPQQMFWISAAQVYCAVERTEALKNAVVIDEHAPKQFRVLGPFRNMKYFSEDFDCPEGSPMNPKEKCEVW